MRMLMVILTVILLGCKENKKLENRQATDVNDDILENVDKIWCQINFPDTVYKNKKYNGEILFVSQLDTITTVFTDKQKDRYVIANIFLTKNINYDHNHLKKVAKALYGAVDNRHIPLDSLVFYDIGDYFIDAIVNDAVYIDSSQKNEKGEELLRLIEAEVRVTKKVVVIEKE